MRRASAAIFIILLGGCARPPEAPRSSATPSPLTIEVLYPDRDTTLEMGQDLRAIVRLAADDGTPVSAARVTARVLDPAGRPGFEVGAEGDGSGVYRTPRWTIPHRSLAGSWNIEFTAEGDGRAGAVVAPFGVDPSTSEELLARYGFWIDAPTLGGIDPVLSGEFGDARDGRLLWGGVRPAVHILPATWIEIQWREDRRPLDDEQDVLRFFREDLGRFGFTPIRSIGPITPTIFKDWPAWHVAGRGEFRQDQVEWVVFYSPEVNRTYAIGTTVVLPPAGPDAPTTLRDSFAVFPEIEAKGVAPVPLPDLLPAPDLTAPPMAAEFRGEIPIVLSWDWVRPLADDEWFQVRVDFNNVEANPQRAYTTRENQLTLPLSLYQTPNCEVFNWQVRVIRDGQPVSFDSLYAYLLWSYPPDSVRPFLLLCPNAQY
jgi:hypothetical protein